MARDVGTLREFDRAFKRLQERIRRAAFEKLALLVEDPAHPSLRVKRIRGTDRMWELSVTMNYRITFEMDDEVITLRRIGTHDTLRRP